MRKEMYRIAVGSDHGGFERKEHIVQWLKERNYAVCDFGCHDSKNGYDYPDIAFPVAESVSDGRFDRGILICTTGIGMCIAANKVNGIRCSLCHDAYSAEMTRRHNDANVLALGAHSLTDEQTDRIVETWLDTSFEGDRPGLERHKRRVNKITEYEKRIKEDALV